MRVYASRVGRVATRRSTQAEALYIAERSARDEVRARAEVRQANALRDKEAQEARLRDLAAQAREERNNLQAARGAPRNDGAAAFFDGDDQLLEEEDAGRREREQVRIERKREQQRARCFEIAQGSPLTEEELNATKKSQINAECPNIANPNYIPY